MALFGAFLVLTGLSALAVVGWAQHGESIFIQLAQGAWINCF